MAEQLEQVAAGIYVNGRGEILVDRDIAHPEDIREVQGIEEEEEVGRRKKNKGGGLRDRISDARQQSLSNRQGRSENREERRDDRKEDRQERREEGRDDRKEPSMSVQTVYEIPTATNGGAGTADTDATILMQYDWFKVRRIIDNGSTGTSRIKQIWAGKVLLVDYGTTGILCSNFAITSQLITNANLQNLTFKAGYNLRVVYSLAAAGVGSMIFEGEAPVQASLCGM